MPPVAADNRPLVVFLMGPTAMGKTDLAVALVEHLPLDIISVDSAQVYRGMDIGTAKPDAELRARVPHRLIDIRDPAETYSVAEFLVDVQREIAATITAGRIPFLVGGTLHYFRVLLDGLANLPPACADFRQALAIEAEAKGWAHLHARLAAVDPETAASLHPNHSQRIQRALEVYELTGVPLAVVQREHRANSGWGIPPLAARYRVVQLALLPDNRQLLHSRIEQRFAQMLELGFVGEVERLYRRGDLVPTLPALRAVGYRHVWGFLAGEYDFSEMTRRAVAATRQLAKRQLTWLRGWERSDDVQVENSDGTLEQQHILTNSLKFLGKYGLY
ncbi:MAG: tRNA (adenosine(37)-N6)-dimethylallyltransferase MiaA [Porticoccaceae bacterium]